MTLPQPIRQLARAVLPEGVKRRLRPPPIPPHATLSFAQEGEDKILASLFVLDRPDAPAGFYVDVGAHHPERFSNTAVLHRRGWRGINVDPLPGSMALFAASRPADVNLEVGISAQRQRLTYYAFNEPALNGFSARTSGDRDDHDGAKIIGTTEVQTLPLADVLRDHVPAGVGVDLLNVDVEGLDLDVLRSNDWDRVRPVVITVEDGDVLELGDVAGSAVAQFLAGHGYGAFCKTPLTTFYIRRAEVERGIYGMRLPRYDGKGPAAPSA